MNTNLNKIDEIGSETIDYQINNLQNLYNEKDRELKELMFKESNASNQVIIEKNKVKENPNKSNSINYCKNQENMIEETKNNFKKSQNENTVHKLIFTNNEANNDNPNSQTNSHIKIEIEHLDEEIKELQNRLKIIIQAKNN